MRAVKVSRQGGPEVMEVTDVPEPVPGAGEVLIDVAASGVNYVDIYFRTGLYAKDTPYVAGVEGAGTVAAVGPGVTDVAPGDRVAWANVHGSLAERAVVAADRLVPVPDGVELTDAAAGLLQGMTAQYLVTDTYPIKPGDTVLVHAAAGGMGLLLTQYAALLGARVIATVSTPEKEKLARAAGADEVLGYDGFAPQVRELTGGTGVDAVFDGVGATTFDGSLASLRRRGMMVLYGTSSGPVPPVDPERLTAGGSLFLTRPSLGDFTVTREELLGLATAFFARVAAGELKLSIGARYDLADARTAYEDLESRRTTGKLLVIP